MSRTIGGPITPAGLAVLLGERPGRGLEHQPPHARSLADARHALRQASAALKATEHPNPTTMQEIGRLHALVADALCGVETLGQRL